MSEVSHWLTYSVRSILRTAGHGQPQAYANRAETKFAELGISSLAP